TGFGAVIVPRSGFHELRERIRVAILQEVAGLLPSKKIEGRHAPGGAGIVPLAHEEFEEKRRHVEAPLGFAVGKNGAEEAAGAGAAEEVLLVGGFIVR